MSWRGYLVLATLAACVGCAGRHSPVDTVSQGIKDELARSGLTAERPTFPVGEWTTELADGCRIDLYVEEGGLRVIAHMKDGHTLTCDGRCSAPAPGMLIGVMRRSDLTGPNVEMSSETMRPFDLRFTVEGDELVVTRFTGGGWTGHAAESFQCRYRRAGAGVNIAPG